MSASTAVSKMRRQMAQQQQEISKLRKQRSNATSVRSLPRSARPTVRGSLSAALSSRRSVVRHMHSRPASARAPVLAVADTAFPVITGSNHSFHNITLKAGQRLLLVPTVGGKYGILGVQIDSNSTFWTTSGNGLGISAIKDDDNVQTGTADNNWQTPGGPYLATVDAYKSIVAAPVKGIDYSNLFAGVEPTTIVASGNSKVTLASGSFDLDIACGYLASARVSLNSTDTLPGFRYLENGDMQNNDGQVRIITRRGLTCSGAASHETCVDVINAFPPEIVGPGQQRSFAMNYHLAAPCWWYTGRTNTNETGTGSTNYNNAQIPNRNPFFHMYATGCYAFVDAIGGDIYITAKQSRTNHVEFLAPGDETLDSAALPLMSYYGSYTHMTSTAPSHIDEWFRQDWGRFGVGSDTEEAFRDLDRKSGVTQGTNTQLPNGVGYIHPPPSKTRIDLFNSGMAEDFDIGKSVSEASFSAPKQAATAPRSDASTKSNALVDAVRGLNSVGRSVLHGAREGFGIAKEAAGLYREVKSFADMLDL